MRFTGFLAVTLGLVAAVTLASAHGEPPAMPDMRGYHIVPVDGFIANGAAYFQAPVGLLCAILSPASGTAGCSGRAVVQIGN